MRHDTTDPILPVAPISATGLFQPPAVSKVARSMFAPVRAGYKCGLADALDATQAPLRKTLTYKPGKKITDHRCLGQDIGMRIFFVDPHLLWPRCANDNT